MIMIMIMMMMMMMIIIIILPVRRIRREARRLPRGAHGLPRVRRLIVGGRCAQLRSGPATDSLESAPSNRFGTLRARVQFVWGPILLLDALGVSFTVIN